MSRSEIVNAVIAKHDAPADAEPAPDASRAPPAGASGAGSASADVEVPSGAQPPGGAPTSPEATIDHDLLRSKLQIDRARRRAKAERRQSAAEREAAEKARKEAEELAEKGRSMSWMERAIADKKDPRVAYQEMQAEARKAGTPEAQAEAAQKALDAKLAAFESEKVAPLQKTIEQITRERDEAVARAAEQGFVNDFQRGLSEERFRPLLDEYDPPVLFRLVSSLRKDPPRLFEAAKSLNVRLTDSDGTFSMVDILNVLRATQAAHQDRMQRRNQSAAPHTSQAGQQQPPQAKPPVNGTVERNAGQPTTIGNDLATSSASEADILKGMTKAQRVAYLERKYANAR